MKKMMFQIRSKKPEIELNKPTDKKFWQKKGVFTIWYFVIMMILLYFLQSAVQMKKEEIPYSQFQKYLDAGQISECVIKEKYIIGTLKLKDKKNRQTTPFYHSTAS